MSLLTFNHSSLLTSTSAETTTVRWLVRAEMFSQNECLVKKHISGQTGTPPLPACPHLLTPMALLQIFKKNRLFSSKYLTQT